MLIVRIMTRADRPKSTISRGTSWLVSLMLASASVPLVRAGSVICTLTPANSVTPVSEPCGQALFTPTDLLNWGQLGSASGYSGFGQAANPPSAGPMTATSLNGLGVTLDSSNMQLERADNTIYAWSNTLGWTSPSNVAGKTINTFGGHFGAPATPTDTPPFGDNLMGVVPGSTGGNAALSLSFSQPVFGAGFQVSSLSNTDFIATLQAFDSTNALIATYIVNTNGSQVGGACVGLQQPATSGNPIPCNNAPLIQIADALARIKRVSLTVDDPQGAFVDQLALSDALAPEPSFGVIVGIGILGFGLWARRKRGSGISEPPSNSFLN
jgi:hypothetical protein